MTSVLRFALLALVLAVTSAACNGKGNPNDPGPVTPPGRPPAPTPGTTVITVPLPDSAQPMLLWSSMIIPAEGEQVNGRVPTVVLDCTASGGYRYVIGGNWVIDGQPEPTPKGGFGSSTGPKCDFPTGGAQYKYTGTANPANVRALRLYIWVDRKSVV